MKNSWKMKNWYQNREKDLEVKSIFYLLRKLTRLHWVLMMTKEYNQYASGESNILYWKSDKTKCNNIIKQCKKRLTLMIL